MQILYQQYANLISTINKFRYSHTTKGIIEVSTTVSESTGSDQVNVYSHRDNLIKSIKSFIESNNESQQKALNERNDMNGLKSFINIIFELKVALEMISNDNNDLSEKNYNASKFEGYMVFGAVSSFKDGLVKKIKNLYRSMEEECYSNDEGKWKKHFDYIVNQPAFEWIEDPFTRHRIRDEGHNGLTLDYFVNHDIAKEAKLSSAEVAALRLYTGPLYAPWNTTLRNSEIDNLSLDQWGTCISVLYSAILKLSYLSKNATVYRGINESRYELPDSFTNHNNGKEFAGGVELAFMSTTTDINVAVEYARRGTDPSKCSIFEIPFDIATRGANVQWVSQYPYECELIYPPCTSLTCKNVTTREEKNLSGIRILNVQASVSTAKKDVDNIRTVRDKPHEEIIVSQKKNSVPVITNIYDSNDEVDDYNNDDDDNDDDDVNDDGYDDGKNDDDYNNNDHDTPVVYHRRYRRRKFELERCLKWELIK